MASRNKRIPYVRDGKLYKFDGVVVCSVGPQSGWPDWLRNPEHRSFHFESATGTTCTLVKERRKGSSGETFFYWYAHKRINDRLHRKYVGKAEKLTLARLEQVAQQLSQLSFELA